MNAPSGSHDSQGGQIVVEAARMEDLDTITQFNIRLAHESEAKTLDPDIVRKGVGGILEKPHRGHYVVARSEGQVIGQLMITLEWSDWRNGDIWWIQSVYVHPEFRRLGIFKKLYRYIREAAVSSPDVVGLRLYVEHQNDAARKVYQRLGMRSGGYEVMEEML